MNTSQQFNDIQSGQNVKNVDLNNNMDNMNIFISTPIKVENNRLKQQIQSHHYNQSFIMDELSSVIDDQRSADIQLLIRAHQKIRQLEDQNHNQKINIQKMNKQLQQQRLLNKQYQQIKQINNKLTKLNVELINTIKRLQEQIESCQQNQIQISKISKINNSVIQVQLEQDKFHQQSQFKINTSITKQKQRSTFNIDLNDILNSNQNSTLKYQKKSWVQNCKQQFNKQLQKIKNTQENIRQRSKSSKKNINDIYQIFQSNKSSQTKILNQKSNLFLRTVQRQLQEINSKNYMVNEQRKKSVSSIHSLKRNPSTNKLFTDLTNNYTSSMNRSSNIKLTRDQSVKKIYVPVKNSQPFKFNSTYTPSSSIQPKKGFLKLNQNNLNDDSFCKTNNNSRKFLNSKKNYQIEMDQQSPQFGMVKRKNYCM